MTSSGRTEVGGHAHGEEQHRTAWSLALAKCQPEGSFQSWSKICHSCRETLPSPPGSRYLMQQLRREALGVGKLGARRQLQGEWPENCANSLLLVWAFEPQRGVGEGSHWEIEGCDVPLKGVQGSRMNRGWPASFCMNVGMKQFNCQ